MNVYNCYFSWRISVEILIRANDFEGFVLYRGPPFCRETSRELIISKLDLQTERKGEKNKFFFLTEGSVVSANVLARSELRSEGGFSDFRRAQHAYFVCRHPLVAAFLPRFHVRELRGRTGKSEREKKKRGIKFNVDKLIHGINIFKKRQRERERIALLEKLQFYLYTLYS